MPILVESLGRPAFIAAGAASVSWSRAPDVLVDPLTFGRWLSLAGAVLATLGVACLKDRAAGRTAWQEKRRAAREKAIQQSREIRHDVQSDSEAALDRRLDRWMRD